MLVVCNLSGKTVPVTLPEQIRGRKWKRLLCNREDATPSVEGGRAWLPWEAEIYTCIG